MERSHDEPSDLEIVAAPVLRCSHQQYIGLQKRDRGYNSLVRGFVYIALMVNFTSGLTRR